MFTAEKGERDEDCYFIYYPFVYAAYFGRNRAFNREATRTPLKGEYHGC